MSNKTEWPKECPVGHSPTGVVSGKKLSEPQAHIVMIVDWDATEQTRMPYNRAKALRDEISRRYRAAPVLTEALRRIADAKPDGLDHALDVLIIERCARAAREALTKAGL